MRKLMGSLIVALALGALYAVSDEAHQTFVEGRVGAVLDVAIDTLGVLTGTLAWTVVDVRWRRRTTA